MLRAAATTVLLLTSATACSTDDAPAAGESSSSPAVGETASATVESAPTNSTAPPTESGPNARARVRAGVRTLTRADTAQFVITTRSADETMRRRGVMRPSTRSYLEDIQNAEGSQVLRFQMEDGVEYFSTIDQTGPWQCVVPIAEIDAESLDPAFRGAGDGLPRVVPLLEGLQGRQARTSTTAAATAPLADVLGFFRFDLGRQAGLPVATTARVDAVVTFGDDYHRDDETVRGLEISTADLAAAILAAGGQVPDVLASSEPADMALQVGLSNVGDDYPVPPLTDEGIIHVPPGASEAQVAEAGRTCRMSA